MREKQRQQFNQMRAALIQISKGYQTTNQLRKNSNSDFGCDYEDALEMAYENIQELAKRSVKGIKEISNALQGSDLK